MIPPFETNRSANHQELVFSKKLRTAPGSGLGRFQEAWSQVAQSCAGVECPWHWRPQDSSRHLSLLPPPLLCKDTTHAPPGLLPASELGSLGLSVFPEETSSGSRELPPFPVFPELAESTDTSHGPSKQGGPQD